MRMEVDEHHRHKDVYTHSLTVLRQAIALEARYGLAGDLVLRLAAILHDIGKPRTRSLLPGGKVAFHHHEVVGAKMAGKRLAEPPLPQGRDRRRVPADRAAPAVPWLRRRRVDRLRGTPVRDRRRPPPHPAARAYPGGLHDAERAEGRPAGSGLRRPGRADRGAAQAGGDRRHSAGD